MYPSLLPMVPSPAACWILLPEHPLLPQHSPSRHPGWFPVPGGTGRIEHVWVGREAAGQQGRGLRPCCLRAAHEHPRVPSVLAPVHSLEWRRAMAAISTADVSAGWRQSEWGERQKSAFLPLLGKKPDSKQVIRSLAPQDANEGTR